MKRNAEYGKFFLSDLAGGLANKVQLTTDGHHAYLEAVDEVFGANVDYACSSSYMAQRWQKRANTTLQNASGSESNQLLANRGSKISQPLLSNAKNLTMRMGIRQFTRLTNGFSKKVQNLEYTVALHFMHYNFCRIHLSLRVSPAMAAGVTDRLWNIGDVIVLLEEKESN